MEKIILNAEPREITGSQVKQLRNEGKIPAVLYGRGFTNQNLCLDKNDFKKILRQAGSSTIVELTIKPARHAADLKAQGDAGGDKEKFNILIHEPQRDPISDDVIHADLYKIDMAQELQTEIPLEFTGVSAAVEDLEGNLITNKDALEVKCLPDKLVSEILVDISTLKTFEDTIKVSDVKIPEGIEVLNDPEEIIAQVTPPRSEEELEEMETPAVADEEKAAIENIEAQAEAEKAKAKEGEEAETLATESKTNEKK